MARFILCRHGQTAWNREQRFRGRKDVPLSAAGRAEAEAVGEALAGAGVDVLYASPLTRALETLAPLARRLGKEVEGCEELIDMDFGEIEGMQVEEVERQYPELYQEWTAAPERVSFPGGESLAQVQARAMRGLSRLALRHPDQTLALCSHRVVTKLIMLGLLGVKPDKFWALRQDTACINRFTYDPPHAVVHTVNETFHLQKLGGTLKADF